jgi:LPS-assembly protein
LYFSQQKSTTISGIKQFNSGFKREESYNCAVKTISPYSLLAFLLIASNASLYAGPSNDKKTQWGEGQCRVHPSHSFNEKPSSITNHPSVDAVYLEADTGTVRPEGVSTLQGNVIIQQNDTQFNADTASFDRSNNYIIANGNVVLSATGARFKSNAIKYNLNKRTGIIQQAEYVVGNSKDGNTDAQGKSQHIELINKDELRLKEATFSSCPAPNPTWHLKSSEINLNNKTEQGSAKNVTFHVKGVPVFYLPKMSFPLNNDRKSGFLTPSLRLQSNVGISLPYYLNLAPNYDATITTLLQQRQGLKFDTEFRYLTPKHHGEFQYDFIPEDKSFNNEFRDYFKLQHHTQLTKNTKLNFNAEGVSDEDYFDDLSDSLESSSRSSLQRRLEIVYKNNPWTMSAAVEDYQIIDANDAPYARLPEFKVGYRPKTNAKALKLSADIELVNFDKSDSVTGARFDAKVTASKKWGSDAWFVKPSVSVQSTLYSLNNNIGSNTLNRSLPTFTLDTGLFFDREITSSKTGKKYTQTLEPRLFYSTTPFKDQTDFPIFDTARTNFSATTQLFSENRFTGKDRIADTNQLTFAVSSRIQDRENGKELFSASIGQVYNFSDRKVTLPGGTIETGTRSDLVLELKGRINDNFRISSTALWDHEKKRVSNYELRLNYQDDKKRIANISYRKLNTELNNSALTQLTLSGALPINDNWSFVGSTEQDIENSRNLETLVGLEYHDCCWKTRLVAKRYLTSDNVTYETPIFIEFELKGLGSLGTNARQELKDKIYGYDDY